MNILLAAYRYLSNNWVQIHASTACGCCSCLATFSPDEVIAWTGLDLHNLDDPEAIDKQTALCPKCGAEAVLGDKSGFPVDQRFLGRMNDAWFQQTMIRKPGPKA